MLAVLFILSLTFLLGTEKADRWNVEGLILHISLYQHLASAAHNYSYCTLLYTLSRNHLLSATECVSGPFVSSSGPLSRHFPFSYISYIRKASEMATVSRYLPNRLQNCRGLPRSHAKIRHDNNILLSKAGKIRYYFHPHL